MFEDPQDIELPAIWLFPYMVYISYGFSIIFILTSIYLVIKKKKNSEFREKIRTRNIFVKTAEKIEWIETLSTIRKWARIVLSICITGISLIFLSVALVVPALMFSPLHSFYFTMLLSLLLVWVALGLKEDGRKFYDNCGAQVGKVKPSDYLDAEKDAG
ncbi:unnamed protein product, partial [marine sediment metagenome]